MMNSYYEYQETSKKPETKELEPGFVHLFEKIEPRNVGNDVKGFVAGLVLNMFKYKNVDPFKVEEVRVRANDIDNQMYVKLVYINNNGEKVSSYVPVNKPIKWCKHGKSLILHFREYECPKKKKPIRNRNKGNGKIRK